MSVLLSDKSTENRLTSEEEERKAAKLIVWPSLSSHHLTTHWCGLSRRSEREMFSCWVGPKCFPFVPGTHPTIQSDLPPCGKSQRLTNTGHAASGEWAVGQHGEHLAPLHPPFIKSLSEGQLPKEGCGPASPRRPPTLRGLWTFPCKANHTHLLPHPNLVNFILCLKQQQYFLFLMSGE